MRLLGCVGALTLLSASWAHAQTAKVAAEQKKLEGQWLVVQRTYSSTTMDSAAVGQFLTGLGSKVEIRQDKIAACDPDKAGRYLLVQFDPSKAPKSLNLRLPGKEQQVLPGIYRLENDLLSIIIGTKNARPKSFEQFDRHVLLVLKRAPKMPSNAVKPDVP